MNQPGLGEFERFHGVHGLLHNHAVQQHRLARHFEQVAFNRVVVLVQQRIRQRLANRALALGQVVQLQHDFGADDFIHHRLRAADRHRRRVERRRTRVVALRRASDRLHGHGDAEAGDVLLHVNRHGRRLNRRNRAVSAGIGGQNADFLLPRRRNAGEVNADVVVRRLGVGVLHLRHVGGKGDVTKEAGQIAGDNEAVALDGFFARNRHADTGEVLFARERRVLGNQPAPENDGQQEREQLCRPIVDENPLETVQQHRQAWVTLLLRLCGRGLRHLAPSFPLRRTSMDSRR